MECVVRLKLVDDTYSWSKITVVSEYDIDGNKMKNTLYYGTLVY